MAGENLAEMESELYQAVKDYKRDVDHMVTGINVRNENRVKEIKRGIHMASARKKTLGFIVFAAAAAGAVFYYKFVLGIF